MAVQGGPSLAGATRRFTVPYLVESVLLPSRKLSPVFKSTRVLTNKGLVHLGLVIGETGDSLELLTSEAKRMKIAKSDIDQRTQQDISPMPAGLIKKPSELRDILAFLLTL